MEIIKTTIEGLLTPTIRQLVNLRIIRNSEHRLNKSLLSDINLAYRKQLTMLFLLKNNILKMKNLPVSNDVEELLNRYLEELIPVTQEILDISVQLIEAEFHRFISKSIRSGLLI